jgi:hypothetical protein
VANFQNGKSRVVEIDDGVAGFFKHLLWQNAGARIEIMYHGIQWLFWDCKHTATQFDHIIRIC